MTDIIGVFESPVHANRVVADLLSAGLDKSDISLIMSDKAKEKFSSATEDKGDRTLKDAAIGAGTGGVLTALLLGLTTVSAILVPGLPVLVSGPLIAAFEGLGAGAAVGGIAGALSGLGIKAMEASKYEDELKIGNAVVVVHTSDKDKEAAARAILKSPGASNDVGYRAA
jgi:hypothetical protein